MIACLLVAGLLIGVVENPYQWLSEWGFRLQRQWPLATGRPLDPWLALVPLGGTALFCLLAWGPLRQGRGGGLTGLLLLQRPDPSPAVEAAALQSLSVGVQVRRLVLMAFARASGLTVGIESPSASLGATALVWLRARLRPLQALPLPLATAVGGGAGLATAFRSPLMGATYALEELCTHGGLSLVLPCALVGGLGALLHSGVGNPAHALDVPTRGLSLDLWPRALLLTMGAAVAGALFVRSVHWTTQRARGVLQRTPVWGALGAGSLLALLALASGGVSLNDGQLTLVPLLTGTGEVTAAQGAARFLASVLSVALGAPGGVMHDTMTLGACASLPASLGLDGPDRAVLAAVGAVALFSGATGTPLFCAIFVFTLQGDSAMLTPLLFCSALACVVGKRLNPVSWNEIQVDQMAVSVGAEPQKAVG